MPAAVTTERPFRASHRRVLIVRSQRPPPLPPVHARGRTAIHLSVRFGPARGCARSGARPGRRRRAAGSHDPATAWLSGSSARSRSGSSSAMRKRRSTRSSGSARPYMSRCTRRPVLNRRRRAGRRASVDVGFARLARGSRDSPGVRPRAERRRTAKRDEDEVTRRIYVREIRRCITG